MDILRPRCEQLLPLDFLLLLGRENQIGAVGVALRQQIEQVDGLLRVRLLHPRRERGPHVTSPRDRWTAVADHGVTS